MSSEGGDQGLLWVEKYRPRTIDDVVAGKKIVEPIVSWAEEWKKGNKQKPLLLAGPPGLGKTSIALAVANTYGWEPTELNASDQRNLKIINRIVGEGAFSSVFEGGTNHRLLILDEVDNIHGREDYGGESALRKILKRKPPQPFILIANEPYKLSPSLRNLCKTVNFRRLTPNQIASVLSRIVKQEGLEANKDALTAIAKNSGGDLRAAINDLQAIARRKTRIKAEDVKLTKRTQEIDIFKVLVKLFKKLDPEVYYDSMQLDETPEDMVTWVEENLPLDYSGEELFRGYMVLSNADIFLGRVRRRQYYRLWKYAGYLITAGVQQVKDEERGGFTRYRRPEVWKKLFQTKSRRTKLDKILAKIGKKSHLSKKSAYSEMYYAVSTLLSRLHTEKAAGIAAFYEFDEEDLAFILGDEKRAEEMIGHLKKGREEGKKEEEALFQIKSKSKSKSKQKEKGKEEKKSEDKTEKAEDKESQENKEKDKSKDTTTTLDFFS